MRFKFYVWLIAGLALAGHAAVTDTPIAWSQFTIIDYTFNGTPVRDIDGDAGTDGTSGGSGISPRRTDISSGATSAANASAANCNPPVSGGLCGPATSVFWGYYDAGTAYTGSQCSNPAGAGYDADFQDDFIFFRLRLNGNPATNGALTSNHWNIMLDIDGDGFKEFYVDIDGTHAGGNSPDQVKIFYENLNSNKLSNPTTALRNVYRACNTTTASGSCATSHTRVINIGDGTAEYYLDVQVPLIAFVNASGVQQFCPDTPFGLFFSTSASNTNPLQKDFSQPCPGALMTPEQPCSFGDTTPVSLTYVSSSRNGNGFLIEWATTIEAGHAGFELYTAGVGGSLEPIAIEAASEPAGASHGRVYRTRLDALRGAFYLADLSSRGERTLHGPFFPGRDYGTRDDAYPVDWARLARSLAAHDRLERSFARARVERRLMAKAKPASQPLAELVVADGGIVRVRFEDLAAAGVTAPLPARDLALMRAGEPLPIWLEATDQFGPGDHFEFVAEVETTLYADHALYLLALDRPRARRIQAAPDRVRPERPPVEFYWHRERFGRQAAYSFAAPNGDPWFDAALFAAGTPVQWDLDVSHRDVYPAGGAAELVVDLWGVTDWPSAPDHHVEFEFGPARAELRFDGLAAERVSLSLPAAALDAGGSDRLIVRLTGDTGNPFDLVHLDDFELHYPRRPVAVDGALDATVRGDWFEVRGLDGEPSVYRLRQGRVERLAGEPGRSAGAWAVPAHSRYARYLIADQRGRGAASVQPPVELRPVRSAPLELLLVTHPLFRDQAEAYAALKSAAGVPAGVVDVETIYRSDGTGVPDADAIRRHIARLAGSTGLRAVLLVGGDTYDYLGHGGSGSISYVPTIYSQTDDLIHFAPSDALFGDLDGDGVPELAVGRWPVRSPAELDAVIAKTLAFELRQSSGRAVMVADRNGSLARYDGHSDFLVPHLPPAWSVERIYLTETSPALARAALFDALNRGPDLVSYVGHSSFARWSFDDLLSAAGARSLVNPQPFAVTQQGCWNTYYVEAAAETMGHALLLNPAGGAALVMGPSALADARHEMDLALALVPALTRLPAGEAILEAKRVLAQSRPNARDMLAAWSLLGDPTLRVGAR